MKRLSEAAACVLRQTGHGRRREAASGCLALDYRRAGGDGLVLTARLAQTPVRLWLDEAQWCRWIEPVLPVPDWAATPAALQAMLAAWTLAGADAGLEQDGIAWPVGLMLAPCHVAMEPDWCLGLERAGVRLDVRLLEVPLAWIDTLTTQLPPDGSGAIRDTRVPVALVAGWTPVAAACLQQLARGDALLLGRAYRVADGDIGLFANAPLARLSLCGDGTYRVGEVMEETDNWVDAVPTADGVMLTVVAELGTLLLPLATLGGLRTGDVLAGVAHLDAQVTLKIAGRVMARGMLLDIGGRLAVRIEQLG